MAQIDIIIKIYRDSASSLFLSPKNKKLCDILQDLFFLILQCQMSFKATFLRKQIEQPISHISGLLHFNGPL